MVDCEAEPLLPLKSEEVCHRSSLPPSSTSRKTSSAIRLAVIFTIVSSVLVIIACFDEGDVYSISSIIGVGGSSSVGGSDYAHKSIRSESESNLAAFTTLFREIEQPGDIAGFAPDIMKLLENNITDEVDYGYGVYNFMARDAEDFPQFVDDEGYIYRVWPFENIVRYVPGGTKTMELSKIIGKFDHLADDGNMILLNGSYCPQIDGEMSATMVVKCASEKKLDMIEPSACKYHFTAYHPTICTPQPTESPIIAPSSTPTHVPTMYSSAPTFAPTLMPAYPSVQPTPAPTFLPTEAPVMPAAGQSNPDSYGHLSYLQSIELPTHEDRINGYVYEIQPFNQVIRYIVDEHNSHLNSSLIGVFDGLNDEGNIIVRDGVRCSDGSGNNLGGTISVSCGGDDVFEMNKIDACTFQMNLFLSEECTGTPTSVPTTRPTSRPNTEGQPTMEPTAVGSPATDDEDASASTVSVTLTPTWESTGPPDVPSIYINDPQTYWPTNGLLPCDQVDVDSGASVDLQGPTVDGVPLEQLDAEAGEMTLEELNELDRKVKSDTSGGFFKKSSTRKGVKR